MDEIQIIKSIFGIFLSLGAAVLMLIAFRLYYKYLVQEKRKTYDLQNYCDRLCAKGQENGG